MKLKKVFLLPLVAFGLAACANNESSQSVAPSSSDEPTSTTSSEVTPTTKATLVEAYASAADLAYYNARPTYNYYQTTFRMEFIDLYSDNTYCLTHASAAFSALDLPDTGNDAKGNERENFVTRYYGSYTKATDSVDETASNITLNTPNRIISNYDGQYLVDTANFSPVTQKDSQGNVTATYNTANEYLQAYAFNQKTVMVSSENTLFDYFEIRGADETVSNVEVKNIGPGITTSYMSAGKLYYRNMRPNYNYYMTFFTQETIELIDTNTYCLNIYSSMFSGLNLPEEGNNATGSERLNYRLSFYGTYTKAANELDETASEITLSAPTRITNNKDGAYFVDSDNWNDKAKTATAYKDGEETKTYATGADYVASFSFDNHQTTVTEENKFFDFYEYTAQLYQ